MKPYRVEENSETICIYPTEEIPDFVRLACEHDACRVENDGWEFSCDVTRVRQICKAVYGWDWRETEEPKFGTRYLWRWDVDLQSKVYAFGRLVAYRPDPQAEVVLGRDVHIHCGSFFLQSRWDKEPQILCSPRLMLRIENVPEGFPKKLDKSELAIVRLFEEQSFWRTQRQAFFLEERKICYVWHGKKDLCFFVDEGARENQIEEGLRKLSQDGLKGTFEGIEIPPWEQLRTELARKSHSTCEGILARFAAEGEWQQLGDHLILRFFANGRENEIVRIDLTRCWWEQVILVDDRFDNNVTLECGWVEVPADIERHFQAIVKKQENNKEKKEKTLVLLSPNLELGTPSKESALLLSELTSEHEKLKDIIMEWLLGCGGPQTRKAYRCDLEEFCKFVEQCCGLSWEKLSGIGASAYSAAIKARHERREISASTAARKLASVSSFFEFSIDKGLLAKNPLERVKRPRVPKQAKSAVLTGQEAQLLLDMAVRGREEAEQTKKQNSIRLARILELSLEILLGTGCRISELLSLRCCDVGVAGEHGEIRFRAKGAEDHAVIVPRELAEKLVKLGIDLKLKESDFLFLSHHGKRSLEQRLASEIKRLCKEVGITKPVTPHVLRATVATILHAKGVPVMHIQRLLNHKDISTTSVYIRRTGAESEAAALQLDWKLPTPKEC